MKKILALCICVFLFAGKQLCAQNAKIDSLNALLSKTTVDTARASLMAQLGWEYRSNDPEQSKQLAEKALELSLKTKYETTEAAAYNLLGIYYYLKRDQKPAREYFNKALALYKKLNNLKGISSTSGNIANILTDLADFDSALYFQESALTSSLKLGQNRTIANSYLNLGNIYNLKGDYSLSMENVFKALKMYEKINDGSGKGVAYYNIARTFYMQEKFRDAITYVKKSRQEREKLNDRSGVATTYILEAGASEQLKNYEQATTLINKAIAIQKELNDEYGLQYSYTILANIFYGYRQFDLSLEYYLKSREISERMSNLLAIASIDYSIGAIYQEKRNYPKAIEYQLSAIKLAEEINAKEELKRACFAIQQTYAKMKDYPKAYEYMNKYMQVKDSLLNEANSNQLNQLQTQYETEKKQKEIELFIKSDEVQKEKIARQSVITYTVVGGLLLVLMLAFILFRRYREKKMANIEITQQKEVIEEKNKEILDSIHYAKRIQKALLASDNLLKSNLPEYFVFYKPKDIVSGDFYWATAAKNEEGKDAFIIATCDCTGHGVPGAFMSLLNISKLNETISERKIVRPDLILNNVRKEIIGVLSADDAEEKSRDGMDAVVCAFDFKNLKLEFAAANNPVIIMRDNKMVDHKADKFPVGVHQGELKPFTLKQTDLHKGDCIYTFTDGFSDQFGGDKGKKMMSKNFKELLLSISEKPMQVQRQELEDAFNQWKGSHEQIDDVLVIGIRV